MNFCKVGYTSPVALLKIINHIFSDVLTTKQNLYTYMNNINFSTILLLISPEINIKAIAVAVSLSVIELYWDRVDYNKLETWIAGPWSRYGSTAVHLYFNHCNSFQRYCGIIESYLLVPFLLQWIISNFIILYWSNM